MDSKKPWFSKTMWLNFIGGLVGAIAVFYPQASVVSDFMKAHAAEIAMVWGVFGMALRLITKDKLALAD